MYVSVGTSFSGLFQFWYRGYYPQKSGDSVSLVCIFFLRRLFLWVTGRLRVNSYSVKGGLMVFPLFLLEGDALLPMTHMADCAIINSGPSVE